MPSQITILQQGYSSAFYDMPLHIVMRPTFHCNYNCSYCNQDATRPSNKDFMDWEKIKGVINRIASLNRSEYIFGFSGGEPTIYPHFDDMLGLLVDTIGEKLTNVYLITNGSRQGKLYDRIAEFSTSIPFNIAVSIHTDHVKQDHIDYLTHLLSEKCHLKYNLMFNPAKKEYVHSIYDQLCRLREEFPFTLEIQTIRELDNGEITDRRYLPEDFEWQRNAQKEFNLIAKYSGKLTSWRTRENTSLITSNFENGKLVYDSIADKTRALQDGLFNHAGNYCVAGTHLLSIVPSGHAFNTICNMSEKSAKPLYEANPYDDEKFARVVKCKQSTCGCRGNDFLQKFHSLYEANVFLKHFLIKQRRLIQDGSQITKLKNELAQLRNAVKEHMNASHQSPQLPEQVDANFYLNLYPDVAASDMSAEEHYLLYGKKEGRFPNSFAVAPKP